MSNKKRSTSLTSTPAHLKARVDAVRARLDGWGADALLVTNPVDIRYLTGFVGDDSWALVTQRGYGSPKVLIFSDFRFKEQIAREAPQAVARMRKKSLIQTLDEDLKRRKIKKLAISEQHITLAQRKALAKQLGARALVVVNDGLLEQRAVKTQQEISAIRKALSIQQEAYRRTLDWMEIGFTENQIAAYLEYQMRSLGADGTSFPSIVAAGPNAALPHAIPGSRRIRKGAVLLIDWGARYKGYCGDLTRVVTIGGMSRQMREVYSVVLEAQLAAIDAIGPGVRLQEIDAKARKVISRAGYGKYFGHALGHGIGLDVHEQPVLSARSKGELRPGQIVTVEPGIYLPKVGGVRIEDDVLVTDRGRRVLSDLPSSIESAMI